MNKEECIKQHYIPQFLMRGFLIDKPGNKNQVRCFRKGGKSFNPNTDKIGFDSYFYGQGESSADHKIGDAENEFIGFLNSLRDFTETTSLTQNRDIDKLAKFAAHLSVRTKNWRNKCVDSNTVAMEKMADYISNYSNFKDEVESYREIYAKVVREKFARESKYVKKQIIDHQMNNLRLVVKQHHKELSSGMLNNFLSGLTEQVEENHRQMLFESAVPIEMVENLKKLNWFVLQTEKTLILGDTISIVESDGLEGFRSHHYETDNIINFFLPISKHKLVVGTSKSTLDGLDVQKVNEASSRLSLDFFIYSNSIDDEKSIFALVPLIGESAYADEEPELAKQVQIEIDFYMKQFKLRMPLFVSDALRMA